jgi:hypothetical protein
MTGSRLLQNTTLVPKDDIGRVAIQNLLLPTRDAAPGTTVQAKADSF